MNIGKYLNTLRGQISPSETMTVDSYLIQIVLKLLATGQSPEIAQLKALADADGDTEASAFFQSLLSDADEVATETDLESVGSFDPSTGIRVFDDFIFTSNSYPGLYAWTENNVGTGADSGVRAGPVDAELNHIGCYQAKTGTTSTGRAGGSNGLDIPNLTFGNGVSYRLDLMVHIDSNLPDVTDPYEVALGFSDTQMPFGYNAAAAVFVFNNNSPNWHVESCGVTTFQAFDTGIAVTPGWHKFTITCNAAGTDLRWYIDDVQAGQTTDPSTIPQDIVTHPVGIGWSIEKSAAGTNSREIFVDYVDLTATFTTPR